MHGTKISRLKRESSELYYEPKSGKRRYMLRTKGSKQKRTAPTFSGEYSRVPRQAEPRSVPIAPEGQMRAKTTENGTRNQHDARSGRSNRTHRLQETRTPPQEPPVQQPGAVRSPPPSIVATARKGKGRGRRLVGVAWRCGARGID